MTREISTNIIVHTGVVVSVLSLRDVDLLLARVVRGEKYALHFWPTHPQKKILATTPVLMVVVGSMAQRPRESFGGSGALHKQASVDLL